MLANCNHNYLVSGRRRHYLRNMGGLTFFEVCDVFDMSEPLYSGYHFMAGGAADHTRKVEFSIRSAAAMVQIAGPATYTTYLKAARRLQLPEDAAGSAHTVDL